MHVCFLYVVIFIYVYCTIHIKFSLKKKILKKKNNLYWYQNPIQQYFSYIVAVSFNILVEENVVRVEYQLSVASHCTVVGNVAIYLEYRAK